MEKLKEIWNNFDEYVFSITFCSFILLGVVNSILYVFNLKSPFSILSFFILLFLIEIQLWSFRREDMRRKKLRVMLEMIVEKPKEEK